jgi:hypothetical protein
MEEQSRAHEFAPGGINDPLDDGSSNSTANDNNDDDVSGEFWRDDDDNDAAKANAQAED